MGIFLFQQYKRQVNNDTEIVYDIRSFISSDTEIVYALFPVHRDLEIIYSIRHEVSPSDTELIYIILDGPVSSNTELIYGIQVASDTEIKYDMPKAPVSDTEIVYILATTVNSDTQLKYDLSDKHFVASDTKILYVLIDFISEQIENSITAEINGDPVELFEVEISGDDDSYCADFSATVSDATEWAKCTRGSEIDITINGTTYNMMIDSRKRSRGFENISYSIDGRSITAKLGNGFASPITKTWGAVSAKSVVDELCTAESISYEFNISDWILEANTLSAESEFPIQIIDKIARAAGGIVQTKNDGTLVVRYKYPTPPPNYFLASVTPDLSISDNDDIYDVEESGETKPGYNKVRVMSDPGGSSQSYSITMNSYDVATRSAILSVISYPFDEDINIRFFTSHIGENVDIQYLGIIEEQKTEQVEIVNGKGSVEFPIISIDNTDYLNNTDLGSISSSGTEIKTNVQGQSIVEITYTTKYHQFSVRDLIDEQVQVYIEEEAA